MPKPIWMERNEQYNKKHCTSYILFDNNFQDKLGTNDNIRKNVFLTHALNIKTYPLFDLPLHG